MLIFNENSDTIILENIQAPVPTDYFWVLDMQLMDYTLSPLQFLEEVVCPSMTVSIHEFEFILPANWNLLVYDPETLFLDVVEIADLAGKEFTALIHGVKNIGPTPGIARIIDYHIEHKNVSPSLNKNQMLCLPVSPTMWINVAPSDGYNKYLKECIVSDIIQFQEKSTNENIKQIN